MIRKCPDNRDASHYDESRNNIYTVRKIKLLLRDGRIVNFLSLWKLYFVIVSDWARLELDPVHFWWTKKIICRRMIDDTRRPELRDVTQTKVKSIYENYRCIRSLSLTLSYQTLTIVKWRDQIRILLVAQIIDKDLSFSHAYWMRDIRNYVFDRNIYIYIYIYIHIYICVP